jgi:hypothetical protein
MKSKKPTRGGARKGAGRKPSTEPKAVTVAISMLPADLEKLDTLKGDGGRSAWVVARIRKAKLK